MRLSRISGRFFICTLLLQLFASGLLDAQAGRRRLDNNLRCLDLSDLKKALPLVVVSSKRILEATEDWERSTWSPGQKHSSLGYPSLVRNDHGKNADGKYYLYFAHHDPTSGIGCAVAEQVEGPYRKIKTLEAGRAHSMVLVNPHYPGKQGDPSHFSSPCVIWCEEEKLWFLYFHYYNHYHGAWKGDPSTPGQGNQMTALAVSEDLSSHRWRIVRDEALGKVSVHEIAPVLPTTKSPWMESASSYHTIQRLPGGGWLAFLRGTPVKGLPTLGFATSKNGRQWDWGKNNPVLHPDDGGKGHRGIYRPGFIAYLGKLRSGKRKYLLVWTESPAAGDVPQPRYGYTTDFIKVVRDPRGHAKWPAGDGLISPWREGNRLYLFTGKDLHIMKLSGSR
ncbi:MAG: hypothetical protein VCD34_03115 [Planctomycetota bacterium]